MKKLKAVLVLLLCSAFAGSYVFIVTALKNYGQLTFNLMPTFWFEMIYPILFGVLCTLMLFVSGRNAMIDAVFIFLNIGYSTLSFFFLQVFSISTYNLITAGILIALFIFDIRKGRKIPEPPVSM